MSQSIYEDALARLDHSAKFADIDPEAVDQDDVEMMQDMVLAAMNEAIKSAQQLANSKMGGLTGGLGDMGLPGM